PFVMGRHGSSMRYRLAAVGGRHSSWVVMEAACAIASLPCASLLRGAPGWRGRCEGRGGAPGRTLRAASFVSAGIRHVAAGTAHPACCGTDTGNASWASFRAMAAMATVRDVLPAPRLA